MGDTKRYIVTKDPDAVLPYGFDWSSWLITGDSVSTAAWSITSPTGDASPIEVDSTSVASNIASATISGGTVGNEYQARCRITTANNLVDDRTIYILVKQR